MNTTDKQIQKFDEKYYRETWRQANKGIRTDWDLISEDARKSWREKIDKENR